MLAPIAEPPHLAGIFPIVTASNYHDGWMYQGGAFEQWFSQSWTSGLAQDTLHRRVQQSSNALQWVWKLPLIAYPLFEIGNTEGLASYFVDWLKHPSYDPYWRQWSIEENYSKIKVPAYHVGGWYDIFMGGTVRNYVGIRSAGGNESAKRGQRTVAWALVSRAIWQQEW